MKKSIALLLILAMVCATFAGCAQPATETATESTAADATATEAAAEPTAETSQAPTKLTLILRGGTYGEVIKAALPEFEKAGLALCLENLPSVEAFPDEGEMAMLKQRFDTPSLAYWHDMGHGQVRANLGLIGHADAALNLLPFTRGIHIHDALPPTHDHLPPGQGTIDFAAFDFYAADAVLKVFEPAPQVKQADLAESLRFVRRTWAQATIPVS